MTCNWKVVGVTLVLLMAATCESNPDLSKRHDLRVRTAELFTQRYAHSRLSDWKVRASAAGPDCDALFVETSVIMEDSMVEAMHYGAGPYDVFNGGVQRFCRERSFRGVAYKDSSGRLWTYGAVTPTEAEEMKLCH